MSYEMKKIKLEDGNMYVPVKERIIFLKAEKTPYRLETKVVLDSGYWVATAILTIIASGESTQGHAVVKNAKHTSPDGRPLSTGAELAETKAVGRALAFFGIGIEDGIASAEEMAPQSMATSEPEPSEDKAVLAMRELNTIVERHHGRAQEGIVAEGVVEKVIAEPGAGELEPAREPETAVPAPSEPVVKSPRKKAQRIKAEPSVGTGDDSTPEETDEVVSKEKEYNDFYYNLKFESVPKSVDELATEDPEFKYLFVKCIDLGVNPYCLPGTITLAKMQKLIACGTREKLEAYISTHYGRAFLNFLYGNWPIENKEVVHPATSNEPLKVVTEEKMELVDIGEDNPFVNSEPASSDVQTKGAIAEAEPDGPKKVSRETGPGAQEGGSPLRPSKEFDNAPVRRREPEESAAAEENPKVLSSIKIPKRGENGERDYQEVFRFQTEAMEKYGFTWEALDETITRLGLRDKYDDGVPSLLIRGSDDEIRQVLVNTRRKNG